MKIHYYLFLLPLLFSCQNKENTEDGGTSESSDGIQSVEIYQSSDSSSASNFFLKIHKNQVTLYGWWFVEYENEKDTFYYRSQSILEIDSSGIMSFDLDKYELTKSKVTPHNLEDFKPDTTLGLLTFLTYSSFINGRALGDSIEFMAVNNVYDSRADYFIFKKVN